MFRLVMVYSALAAIFCASAAQAITGDLNCDGTVDFSDFFAFSDHFGKEGVEGAECAALVGDFDCNNSVDFSDFFVFSDNFGKEGALDAACGASEVVAGDSSAVFHAPKTLGEILLTSRSVAWTAHTSSPTDLMHLSLGVAGTRDILAIDDSSSSYAAAIALQGDMAASTAHSYDALLKAAFKLIEVGIDTYMLVSAKHANYAVDFAVINGVPTLVMRDYRSAQLDADTAAFLAFSLTPSDGSTYIAASARHVYSSAAGGFVADASWTALNVAVEGSAAILTAEAGTVFTAFALYMPTLELAIPFDFNPTQVARVSNGELAASASGADRLEGSIKDVLAAYKEQVATAGADAATEEAANAMLAAIDSTLAAEGAALRYPRDFYKTVRTNMLSRQVRVADYYDAAIGQHSVPYVYFTNEADAEGAHHPFMVIASYGVTEGMVHLWDVPQPPGDGAPGTSYPEQEVTRSASNQGYFAKIPLRDYGEVETLTENAMVNDLASDAPESVDFTHLNYASTSAVGIALDGVVVYPALNNTLNIAASAGELSSVGVHSGRGLGVHYHADAHGATGSGLNLYNAADYEGHAHPPIISLGFDGVAGYGKYLDGDTTSDGATIALDDWGGHEHGVYAYHYHAEAIAATATTQGPGGSSTAYTAHMLPPKGAWRGRINSIPEFWDGTAPAYGGRPGVYQGIEER